MSRKSLPRDAIALLCSCQVWRIQKRAREVLGKTAQLHFRLVDESVTPTDLLRHVESAKTAIKADLPGDQQSSEVDIAAINKHLQTNNLIPETSEVLFGDPNASNAQEVATPYLLFKNVELTGEKLDDARVSFSW